MSRFQFVGDHRDTVSVKWLCQILEVSRSGFYRWRAAAGARAARVRADRELAERIRRIHDDSDGTYGAPRVTAELHADGVVVNHKRVERLMRERGIVGVHLRKSVRTTVPDPDAVAVPDLIRRDFTASAPNTRYVGDIPPSTVCRAGPPPTSPSGTVTSFIWQRCWICIRNGWRGGIADHMRTGLVTDALRAAASVRGAAGLDGAVFHSDNGAQYASAEFAEVCRELGVTRSRGAVGTSADDAAAESFNATLKRETLQGRKRWNSAGEARAAVFRWVTRYNTRRRHSTLGQICPIEYEQRSATLATAA